MNGDGMGLSWVWLLLILGVAIRVWWLVRASSTPGGGSSTGQARARDPAGAFRAREDHRAGAAGTAARSG